LCGYVITDVYVITIVTDIFAMTVMMIDNDCYKESLLFQSIPTIIEIDRNYGVILIFGEIRHPYRAYPLATDDHYSVL